MARDTNGNYTLPAGNPVASGTVISTTWANPTLADIASALTDSLSRNGDGGMLVAFENVDGDVALPGITWSLEPATGLWREANNDMQAGVAGARVTRWFNDTAVTNGDQNPFQIWDGLAWRDVIRDNHFDPIVFRGNLTVGGTLGVTGAATFSSSASSILFYITGNTSGSGNTNWIGNSGGLWMNSATGTQIRLSVGGANPFTISSTGAASFSGDVGIGTSTAHNTNGYGRFANIRGASNGALYVGRDALAADAVQLAWTTGVASLYTLNAVDLSIGTNNTDRLTLDGTTGAATFATAITMGTGVANNQLFINNSTADMYLGISGGAIFGYATGAVSAIFNTKAVPLGIGTAGAQDLILGTASTARVTIDGTTGAATFASTINLTAQAAFPTTGIMHRAADSKLHFVGGATGFSFDAASGASTLATLDASGNLGLGSAPFASVRASISNGNNSTHLRVGSERWMNFATSSDGALNDAIGSFYMDSSAGQFRWANNNNTTELMRLDASGNLLVGASTPNGKLHVTAASGVVGWFETTGLSGALGISNSGTFGMQIDTASSSGFLTFTKGSGATEFGRFDTSGNLLVGTSTIPTTNTHGIGFINSAGFMTLNCSNNQTGVTNAAIFYNANGLVGTIQTSGTATAYNTSSDPRLKSAFTAPTNALDMLVEARENGYLGAFTFHSDPNTLVWGYNSHALIDNQPGFGGAEGQGPRDMAIGEVYEPAIYETRPVYAERPTLDADGNENGVEQYDTGETEEVETVPAKRVSPAGVDQSKRVPLLEAALYDMYQELKALQAQVAALSA